MCRPKSEGSLGIRTWTSGMKLQLDITSMHEFTVFIRRVGISIFSIHHLQLNGFFTKDNLRDWIVNHSYSINAVYKQCMGEKKRVRCWRPKQFYIKRSQKMIFDRFMVHMKCIIEVLHWLGVHITINNIMKLDHHKWKISNKMKKIVFVVVAYLVYKIWYTPMKLCEKDIKIDVCNRLNALNQAHHIRGFASIFVSCTICFLNIKFLILQKKKL